MGVLIFGGIASYFVDLAILNFVETDFWNVKYCLIYFLAIVDIKSQWYIWCSSFRWVCEKPGKYPFDPNLNFR